MQRPSDRVLQAAVALSLILHLAALAALRMPASPAHEARPGPLTVQLLERAVPVAVPSPRPAPVRPSPAASHAMQPMAVPVAVQPVASAAPAVAEPVPAAPAVKAATAPAAAEVMPPRFDAAYLDNPQPSYPLLSRRLGEQGRVLLRVLVGGEGRAREVLVKQGSGFARLDLAAREAVLRWRFLPARQGSEAVEAWVVVPIVFSLS